MKDALVRHLSEILFEVDALVGSDFSGLGIIVAENVETLPIFPLRSQNQVAKSADVVNMLAKLSSREGSFHDGFHILSEDWALVRTAQYFSPEIIPTIRLPINREYGGRYLAALFGSVLPGVLACGILNSKFELAIFVGGEEKIYKKLR